MWLSACFRSSVIHHHEHEPPTARPMTLGNMRDLGVRRLIASCLNHSCRHTTLVEVWTYPAATEITYFKRRVACAICGARGERIDVRPNWKEQPPVPAKR
jgi:hypothetical protein